MIAGMHVRISVLQIGWEKYAKAQDPKRKTPFTTLIDQNSKAINRIMILARDGRETKQLSYTALKQVNQFLIYSLKSQPSNNLKNNTLTCV